MNHLLVPEAPVWALVANAVQNSINAGDSSLAGGVVSAITLVVLNWTVGWAAYRWRRVERLVAGRPIRLVTDGRIHVRALRGELLTLSELRSALRKQGIMRISDCEQVVLEPDGTFSVVRRGVEQHSLAELAHPDPIYFPETG
jgi:uncharacterized membrane protein YcaP (DUF421 family)